MDLNWIIENTLNSFFLIITLSISVLSFGLLSCSRTKKDERNESGVESTENDTTLGISTRIYDSKNKPSPSGENKSRIIEVMKDAQKSVEMDSNPSPAEPSPVETSPNKEQKSKENANKLVNSKEKDNMNQVKEMENKSDGSQDASSVDTKQSVLKRPRRTRRKTWKNRLRRKNDSKPPETKSNESTDSKDKKSEENSAKNVRSIYLYEIKNPMFKPATPIDATKSPGSKEKTTANKRTKNVEAAININKVLTPSAGNAAKTNINSPNTGKTGKESKKKTTAAKNEPKRQKAGEEATFEKVLRPTPSRQARCLSTEESPNVRQLIMEWEGGIRAADRSLRRCEASRNDAEADANFILSPIM